MEGDTFLPLICGHMNTVQMYHIPNSGANSQISWGGKIFYDVGTKFWHRHAKCPVSAPPIEVKSCTKKYRSLICMHILNIESIKLIKFILFWKPWDWGGDGPLAPLNWRHWSQRTYFQFHILYPFFICILFVLQPHEILLYKCSLWNAAMLNQLKKGFSNSPNLLFANGYLTILGNVKHIILPIKYSVTTFSNQRGPEQRSQNLMVSFSSREFLLQ